MSGVRLTILGRGDPGVPWRASSVLSATSTMLTASADAARYRNNVSPGSGATNTGSEVRCCFSSWKAYSASSVKENGPDLLNSLKKGRALSARLEIKRLRAARDPVSFWTSLMRPGGLIASIALIMAGFASMRDQETQQLPRRDAENTLLGIQLRACGAQSVEDEGQVLN